LAAQVVDAADVSDFEAGTFRAVYVVRLERAIYVLHCFQKKFGPYGTEAFSASP
jgi:phage-related protein